MKGPNCDNGEPTFLSIFIGGNKITIGESSLSSAVVAGIITLEQADKLWRFFCAEVNLCAHMGLVVPSRLHAMQETPLPQP